MKRIFQKLVGRSLPRRLIIFAFATFASIAGLHAQDFGTFTEVSTIPENSWFLVQTNHVVGLRFTRKINSSNLVANLSTFSTWPSALSFGATNLATTNGTTFGVFWKKSGNTLQFLDLKQGSNVVIYIDANSNIVINAAAGGGSGVISTNPFQFAPISTLTLISGFRGTNANLQGVSTNAGIAMLKEGGLGNYGKIFFYDDLAVQRGTLFGATEMLAAYGGLANGVQFSLSAGNLLQISANTDFNSSSVYSHGSNFFGAIKLINGQPAGTIAIVDGNTNLVGWLTTNTIVTQTQLNTQSNLLQNTKLANSGGLGTNETFRGVNLPSLTASRAAMVDANGNLTNVTSSSPSTEFVRADGTAAVPAGAGDVTTAQLNTASNLLSGRIDLSLTNNETRIVNLTSNLTVQGRATNQNSLTVHGGNIRVFGTNGTFPTLTLQDYGSGSPQILQQNANGTESSPTALTSGELVGQWGISGYGDTIYKTAFGIRPTSTALFGDSESRTLVRFGVGDAAGTTLGRAVWWLTAYNFTNDANLIIKSNLTLEGSGLVNGSLTAGSFLSQGIISAVDTVTANTNAHVLGTNRARWLKLDGGQTNSSVAVIDSGTNVVGHPSVTISELANIDGGTGNFQTNLDAHTTAIANTITNANSLGISNGTSKPIFLRKNAQMIDYFTLVSGPNVTLTMSTTNSIVIDAPSSALSDGDKGDITVSGSGSTWTVDIDSITDAQLRESAGFSVIGKATTGTGNPADIVAGTDTVFGRNGSGNLGFAALASGQIAANAVTFAKIQQFSSGRLFGRGSAATGNGEEITPGPGFTMSAGAINLDIGSTLVVSNTAASSVDNTLTRWDGTGGRTIQGSGAVLSDAGAMSGLDTISSTTSVSTATLNANLHQGMSFVASNAFKQTMVNLSSTTNIVLDYAATNIYWVSPSNVFTITINNVPAAANYQKIELILVNTNSTVGYFPTNGMNYSAPVMMSAPSTNWYTFHVFGQNLHFVQSHQDLMTGIPRNTITTNVLNDSPYIVNATNYNSRLAGRTETEVLTNIISQHFLVETRLIPTNSALSNVVVNFALTNTVKMFITNNITLTNWTGLPANGASSSKLIWIEPVLINRGVNWGNLGRANPGYGVAIYTNANSPMLTTLTAGKRYALSIVVENTNIFPTISLFD